MLYTANPSVKVWHKEAKQVDQGHTARKWQCLKQPPMLSNLSHEESLFPCQQRRDAA
jgi:hypothetical protein